MQTYIEYVDPEALNIPTSLRICSKNSSFTTFIEQKLNHYPLCIKLTVSKKLLRNVMKIEIDSSVGEGVPVVINEPISLSMLSTLPLEVRRNLIQSLVTDLIEWLNDEEEEYRSETVRLMTN